MADPYVLMLEARIAALERLIARQARQSRAAFALSRSTAPAIDTGAVQTVQGQIDPLSLKDAIPALYAYGFSSSVPVGGDKVVAFLNGDRSQGVVIATGHQTYRFTGLQTGEVVMHDNAGHSIHLTAAGVVVTGNMSLTGNLTVTGYIHATGAIIAGYGGSDQVGLQTHTHSGSGVAPTAGT